MKKIANLAAYFFILSVVVLSAISILGVWDFFADDVVSKSFKSIGILALVAIIVLIADHFIGNRTAPAVLAGSQSVVDTTKSVSTFKGLRTSTLYVLILSVVLLAFLGIMSIWEVLSGEILHKSLSSIAIVAFSSLIIVVTCLEREGNPLLYKKNISGGMILLAIILLWIFATFLF